MARRKRHCVAWYRKGRKAGKCKHYAKGAKKRR